MQLLETCTWEGEKQAALLPQANGKNPKGLNCLGEFILRNDLDSMPLDQRPAVTGNASTSSPRA